MPIQFGIAQASLYHELRALFKEIEVASSFNIEHLRQKAKSTVEKLVDCHKVEMTELISQIQSRIKGCPEVVLRSSMVLPFLQDVQNPLSLKPSLNIDLHDKTILRTEIIKQWLSLFDMDAINWRKQNQIRTYHS